MPLVDQDCQINGSGPRRNLLLNFSLWNLKSRSAKNVLLSQTILTPDNIFYFEGVNELEQKVSIVVFFLEKLFELVRVSFNDETTVAALAVFLDVNVAIGLRGAGDLSCKITTSQQLMNN